MEFVGKVVQKEFNQLGVFRGTIQSYDSTTGFFKIVYEDGDFEEVDRMDLARLLSFTSDVVVSDKNDVSTKKLGRKSKKRGRKPRDLGNGLKFELDLNCSTDLVDDGEKMVENDEVRAQIDLNLTVESNEIDEVEVKVEKKERGFDLNLGLDDENVDGGNESLDFGVLGFGLGSRSSSDSVVVSNVDVGSMNCEVKVDEGSSSLVGLSLCKDESFGHRKRRRMSKDLNSSAQTVLRRSARRAKAAVLMENETSRRMVVDEVNDLNVSGVTDVSEERTNTLCLEETLVLPPKMELPPCSTNFDLDGVPVMDFFSVYSCLRSFSTLLYLSPFELEEFAEALKSKVSNPLIDFIHVSILRTLRKHLESLANEGLESASTCLRNKNWDLLDVVTWPVFMVEYLLIHGSWPKPGFTFDHLNLFDGEYYKQPTVVKLEMLRCLCDDAMEVEAIRSELGKRMILVDAGVEIDRTMINGPYKKRRISLDVHEGTCLSEDVMEDVADGNSDECCLCKMDGNLICCDGCPAAYHSKCVGIISSLLPEGEWHCPECVIGRPKFGTQPQKLIRGAELIGNDAHGRLYFICFDYLLVSDSCDSESTCRFYHKDDVTSVIQLLQSSEIFNGPILNAIYQHWAIPMADVKHEGRRRRSSTIPGYFSHLGADTVECSNVTQNLKTSSEGSAEVVHEDSSKLGSEICCHTVSTKSTSFSRKRKKNHSLARRHTSVTKSKEDDALQTQAGDGYTNRYGFALTASSIVEELLRKPSDKVNVGTLTTEEQIIAIQLKFILKKSIKFSWITVQNLNADSQKEKCGWCYCCRFPVEGRDCLFTLTNRGPISEGFKAEVDTVWMKKNKKGHLVDVICYILYMEERLRGLLVGPWLSPHHSELWRRSVLKASDVSFLKRPLLMLEANLRPLALSADWWKHVDSVKTMGSSVHHVAKSRATPKNGVCKRKGRQADTVTKSSTAAGGLRLLWWRGGKTSRSLFNWKVVPRPLALKAARKGGYIKIPGIQYPEGSENARRSTCLTWQASVESSTCLEQLALQVRELDLFVRWDDIENSHLHSILDKESLKSIRLFKKVIVRRKCIDGTNVKYLLDFGKRRSIPDVVIKHGLKVDESTVERKKYWLEESYMPLHLLKNFEERRISRKAGKANPNKVRKGRRVIKKPLRSKGFDYLFERAERADSYQCGHCNKNVPISEAVSCELCKDFFHKRHVMKSSDRVTTGCTYTCHGCRSRKLVKTKSKGEKRKFGKLRGAKKLKVEIKGSSKVLKSKSNKKRKVVGNSRQEPLQNHKKKSGHLFQRNDNVYAGMTLRRSARKATSVPLQSNSCTPGNVRKTYKSRDVASTGTPKESYGHKRRTHALHSFWSNGLLLSRKPNDERVVQFKKRKLFVPSEISTEIDDPPKCTLCPEQGFISTSTYICCETCEGWFHGAAFGLDKGNIECVIGFKCHICLDKSIPVCPFTDVSGTGTASTEVTTRSEIQNAQELPENVVQKETDCPNDFHSNEISLSTVEVQKVLGPDGNLDHDRTMVLDSEINVDNGLPTSEVEAQTIENHTEASLTHDEKDCMQGLCSDEILTGIIEDVQSSDLNLVHDKTSILGSEMSMENGSPTKTASHNGLPEVLVAHMETECVHEFHSDENSSGFMEVKMVQSCDGNVDNDKTAILDSVMIMENWSPTVEPGAQKTASHNGLPEVFVPHGETVSVHDFHSDANSPGFIAVQTVQSCDGNVDHDKTPNLNSQMSMGNESPSSKEAEAHFMGSPCDDWKADVPKVLGESDILEQNRCILNESRLMQLDETQYQSPVNNVAEATEIESRNEVLEDVVTTYGEKSVPEHNKNILNELRSSPSDEREPLMCKFVLNEMDVKNSEIADG